MAIENVVLRHECCPQQLRVATKRTKSDKETEECKGKNPIEIQNEHKIYKSCGLTNSSATPSGSLLAEAVDELPIYLNVPHETLNNRMHFFYLDTFYNSF